VLLAPFLLAQTAIALHQMLHAAMLQRLLQYEQRCTQLLGAMPLFIIAIHETSMSIR
jgi:hypothetical protein